MPPTIDATYEPRPWRCDECRTVLGVVLRDSNRVRSLYVFRYPCPGDIPEKRLLFLAASDCHSERIQGGELFQAYALYHGTIECDDCHALTTWRFSQEMLVDLLERGKQNGKSTTRRVLEDVTSRSKSSARPGCSNGQGEQNVLVN